MSRQDFKFVEHSLYKVIMAQIISYTFFTLAFFLSVYSDSVIYVISWIGIAILSFILFLKRREELSLMKIGVYWLFILFAFAMIFLPLNVFTILLDEILLPDPVGRETNFSFTLFFMYYGFLSLFAIISEFLIALYYRYQMEQGKALEKEEGYSIWHYFLIDTTFKKVLILLALLSIASVMEEIVFRYILGNVLLRFNLPLFLVVIITSIIFGLMHYSNGGWVFTINSTFAGIFFFLAFYQMGLITAWLLHFLWNFLIIFQMFLPKLIGQPPEI